MPWKDARSVPFTRLGIVSQVPSEGGVFAVMDGSDCLLVSESWNLKARLLELINVVNGEENLTVTWEPCCDEDREVRRRQVAAELTRSHDNPPIGDGGQLPGLPLREPPPRRVA